jgi:CheY-like chemotaxis protein
MIMNKERNPITIVMADDDEEDRMLTQDAWKECRLKNNLRFVEDGVELMDYLYRRGKFASGNGEPWPGLILLDLNMPRKNGFEALEEIKADPELKKIPIVVLTTSSEEEDICRSYDLGVSGFVTKPVSFDGLVDILKTLQKYWLEIVELPD